MHETSFTYLLKKNQLIEVPGSFLNLIIGTASNMYMRQHIMYYCKYCSFFLAKEISGYRDENTHISSHTGEYSEIHTKGYF
jgi:hypothetical protein